MTGTPFILGDLALIGTVSDERLGGTNLTERLLAAYRDQLTSAVLDHAAIDATDLSHSGVPSHVVPHFDRDLHSLADVAAFAACLDANNYTTTATDPT